MLLHKSFVSDVDRPGPLAIQLFRFLYFYNNNNNNNNNALVGIRTVDLLITHQ